MAEYMGACVYCGQAQLVVGHELDETEVNKLATLQCNCDEAQALQKMEQKKTYCEANIKRLFTDDGALLVQTLLEVVQPLACQRIKKLTATTTEGIRATLTAKENSIKVEHTEVKKSSLED